MILAPIISILLLSLVYFFYRNKIIDKFFYYDIIKVNSRAFGLDPLWVAAIVKVESGFSKNAVSDKGAVGLMQVMPDTAKDVCRKLKIGVPDTERLKNPELNIRLGTFYLAELKETFKGDTVLVLAAYNGGQGSVRKWLTNHKNKYDVETFPKGETKLFIKTVNVHYEQFKKMKSIYHLDTMKWRK